ncbi:MAG: alpha-E domain-containing protein [Pseudomonadota bacterium]
MLSRAAENLYWAGRHVERADATARLLAMGARMTVLPGADARGDWESVMRAAGALPPKDTVVGRLDAVDSLLLSENGSSVRGSLRQARENGRAERTALTTQMWEALNDDWRALDGVTPMEASRSLFDHVDWAIRRSASFRGAVETTMLRNDRYEFLRLGGLIERAGMTLRLLDVKYLALLPERDVVGGGRDTFQWSALLLASSGLRAYHHLYRGEISATNIADLLVFNRAFPRSLAFCVADILTALDNLAAIYAQRHLCHESAAELHRSLSMTDIDEVFADGLHEFILQRLADIRALHNAVNDAYGF